MESNEDSLISRYFAPLATDPGAFGLRDDAAVLKARLAKNPQDDEAVYQLAIQQLARQQYDAALDALLKLFIRNRSYNEGLPHKTLLQVFELLGNDHPLVTTYRRKLFAALY